MLENYLRDHLIEVVHFIYHRLVNGVITFFGSHFFNQAVEGGHRQEVLFIVKAELLTVRLQFFVDHLSSSPNTFFFVFFDLHGVVPVCYPDLD